jgi:glycosyltransferase involved in cell wall biosynthesis
MHINLGSSVRSTCRSINRWWKSYQRSRLIVPTSSEISSHSAIFFLTPDYDRPAGGIRVIYRHVDILNDVGITAFVLHQRRGFRCSWFENNTKIVSVSDVKVCRGDLLVVSEVDIDLLARVAPGTRRVIFNQNCFFTWQRISGKALHAYVASLDTVGIVTISGYSQELLQLAFPTSSIQKIRLSIDPDLFHCGSDDRPRRIAYMPRRGREVAQQVLEILESRGVLRGWDVVPLDGLSHSEVADQLRLTRIFLSFSYWEGFGLPAAEAMACGSYVIGNHGQGGREFFFPEFSTAIEAGDTLAFVRAVEEAVNNENATNGWCCARGRVASDFVLSHYSMSAERDDVVNLYSSLFFPNK